MLSRPLPVHVTQGFISEDSTTKQITNLGRGGSDFTAALIAAALDASALEIWTDVDGFMTADPRTNPDATVIPEMTYAQAQAMCEAGAKVIYTPTIGPVALKHIPVWVKNTFNIFFVKFCNIPKNPKLILRHYFRLVKICLFHFYFKFI